MYSKTHDGIVNSEKEKWGNEIEMVYLIFAHSSPDMLGRLIKALDSNCAHFFIHVDKKTDINAFLPFIPIKQNIHLSENRIKVFWGGYSQVQATLNLMKEAINSGIDFKYAVLLSGSHYPIKSNKYILRKLQNSEREYLQFGKISELSSEFKLMLIVFMIMHSSILEPCSSKISY